VTEQFSAVVQQEAGTTPFVEVPFDVKATFGSARPPVRATVNGFTFRTRIAPMGGCSLVGFNRAAREGTRVAPGQTIRVELELDEEPRTVAVPRELETALDASPEARARYDGLSYTHRREYAEWVAEAKRPETRERRARETVTRLLG
jgi:hypothetical protein